MNTTLELVRALAGVVSFNGYHILFAVDHATVEKQARFKADPSKHSAVFVLVGRASGLPAYVTRTPANLFDQLDSRFEHHIIVLFFASPDAADAAAWAVLRRCGTVYDKSRPGFCKNAVVFADDGSAWIPAGACEAQDMECIAANGWAPAGQSATASQAVPQPFFGKVHRHRLAQASLGWPLPQMRKAA